MSLANSLAWDFFLGEFVVHSFPGKNKTLFHFNSDFSGNVDIVLANGNRIQIPAKDILEFVAFNYVVNERIAKLENMSFMDLLK